MANCEICGTDTTLVRAVIESVEVDVCKACARFGEARQTPASSRVERYEERAARQRARARPPEQIPTIVDDYALRIKRRRERLGITQEELAKTLAERESVVSALENGTREPDIDLAKKIERALSIKLIEACEQKEPAIAIHQTSAGMTLGDIIKRK